MLVSSPSLSTSNNSDWLRSYLPNMFRKTTRDSDDSSEEEEEPLDLADEELDDSEAYDLMLGLPRELCLPTAAPPSPPPKAAEPPAHKPTNSMTVKTRVPSWRPAPPAKKRPEVVLTYEDSILVMDVSCRKLKPASRKERRPIRQTLLIHRTISLVKELRKPPQRNTQNRASPVDEVAKPPPAFCRESPASSPPSPTVSAW